MRRHRTKWWEPPAHLTCAIGLGALSLLRDDVTLGLLAALWFFFGSHLAEHLMRGD